MERCNKSDKVDLGILSEKFQKQVLTRLITAPSSKTELVSLNPWLSHPGEVEGSSAIIENNRLAVIEHYGTNQYRDRLMAIYDRIVNHPVCHRIDKRALREAFFDLDRFSLLQWGTYAG